MVIMIISFMYPGTLSQFMLFSPKAPVMLDLLDHVHSHKHNLCLQRTKKTVDLEITFFRSISLAIYGLFFVCVREVAMEFKAT